MRDEVREVREADIAMIQDNCRAPEDVTPVIYLDFCRCVCHSSVVDPNDNLSFRRVKTQIEAADHTATCDRPNGCSPLDCGCVATRKLPDKA
jgi:hypothetical protein